MNSEEQFYFFKSYTKRIRVRGESRAGTLAPVAQRAPRGVSVIARPAKSISIIFKAFNGRPKQTKYGLPLCFTPLT